MHLASAGAVLDGVGTAHAASPQECQDRLVEFSENGRAVNRDGDNNRDVLKGTDCAVAPVLESKRTANERAVAAGGGIEIYDGTDPERSSVSSRDVLLADGVPAGAADSAVLLDEQGYDLTSDQLDQALRNPVRGGR